MKHPLQVLLIPFTILLVLFPFITARDRTFLGDGYITILATSNTRGNILPLSTKAGFADENCYGSRFDNEDCYGGCARRVAMVHHLRRKFFPDAITVDNGGYFFSHVMYTLFGTGPYEYCALQTGYDVMAVGGSDLYTGLDIAFDFFNTVGIQSSVKPNGLQTSFLPNSWDYIDALRDFVRSPTSPSNLVGNDTTLLASNEDELINQDKLINIERNQHLFDILQVHQQDPSTHSPLTSSPLHKYQHSILQTSTDEEEQTEDYDTTYDSYFKQAQIVSTNLRADKNFKWSSIIRSSAVMDLPAPQLDSNKSQKVAFVSLMPEWYHLSISNAPDWFEIGGSYSSINFIRAEVSRLRRTYGDYLEAIVVLIQEDRDSANYSELLHVEHVNCFITPIAAENMDKTKPSTYTQTNIYGKQVVISTFAGAQYLNVFRFKVDDDGHAILYNTTEPGNPGYGDTEFEDYGAMALTVKTLKKHGIVKPPTIQRALKRTYNPNTDDMSKYRLAELISDEVSGKAGTNSTEEGWGCRAFACPMGVLATQALLQICNSYHPPDNGSMKRMNNCTMAFLNAGSIRDDFSINHYQKIFPNGTSVDVVDRDITLAHVFSVFPFFNKLISFDLKGDVILKLLAHSVSYGFSAKFLQTNVRWAVYPYEPRQSPAPLDDALNRIMDISIPSIDGTFEPISKDKIYRVITLNYLLEGKDGYDRVLNDTRVVLGNPVFHSDTLLTAVLGYLKMQKAVKGIPRDHMTRCLFHSSLPFSTQQDENCLMASTDKTSSTYFQCATNQTVCELFKDPYNNPQFFTLPLTPKTEFLSLGNNPSNFIQVDTGNHTVTMKRQQYVDLYNTMRSSPHDYYSQYYTDDQTVPMMNTLSFYDQVNQLSSSQPQLKRLHTLHTHWSHDLFTSGELSLPDYNYFLQDFENAELSTNLGALDPNTGFSIDGLFPGLHYDPDLPTSGDCAICTGLGTCGNDHQCKCTQYDEQHSQFTLINGYPTHGIYRGLPMIGGVNCGETLHRYLRGWSTTFVMIFMSLITIIVSLLGLSFVCYFRTHPVIKSTSIDLSISMCAGGLLVGVGIYFFSYVPLSENQRGYIKDLIASAQLHAGWYARLRLLFSAVSMCNTSFWIVLLGFMLIFGSLIARLWRIHCIFNAKTLLEIKKVTALRTRLVLCAIMSIQVLLLILIRVIVPLQPMAYAIDGTHFFVECAVPFELKSSPSSSINGNAEDYAGGSAVWSPKLILYVILLCYDGALLIYGAYLSVSTRKVDKRFNESSTTGVSIYNAVLVAVLFFVSMVAAYSNPAMAKIFQSVILAYGVLSTLLLVLVPKFRIIIREIRMKQRHSDYIDGLNNDPTSPASLISSTSSLSSDFTANRLEFDIVAIQTQSLLNDQRHNLQKMEGTISKQQHDLMTLIQYILTDDTGTPNNDEITDLNTNQIKDSRITQIIEQYKNTTPHTARHGNLHLQTAQPVKAGIVSPSKRSHGQGDDAYHTIEDYPDTNISSYSDNRTSAPVDMVSTQQVENDRVIENNDGSQTIMKSNGYSYTRRPMFHGGPRSVIGSSSLPGQQRK